MSLIVFGSGSGAPGTTTSVLAMASVWHKPAIIVEADTNTASAIAAGLFRGTLDPAAGLASLAQTWRKGDNLAAELPGALAPIGSSVASVLAGEAIGVNREQLPQFQTELLAACLAYADAASADVFVDVGRVNWPQDVAVFTQAADVLVVVSRSTLSGVAAATSAWDLLSQTRQQSAAQHRIQPPPGFLCVVGPNQPHSIREIAELLQICDYQSIQLDPVRAEIYSLGTAPPPELARSPYALSVRDCAEAVAATSERNLCQAPVTKGRRE
ncbi:MAG: hypothetical protein K0U64_09495 [Actinomycetia bacterium]|nr:hypothetical protein [Actinomycetes bacterium]